MADLERELQGPLNRVVEENEKKRINHHQQQENRNYVYQQDKDPEMRVTNWRYKHQGSAEVQIYGKHFNTGWQIRH